MTSEAADRLAERVLRAVDEVGPGTVVSYGDIARIVDTAARQVGAVLSQYGAEVAWWRVTDREGRLPPHLLAEAKKHWEEEGIGFGDTRCRIEAHRADQDVLAERYREAVESL